MQANSTSYYSKSGNSGFADPGTPEKHPETPGVGSETPAGEHRARRRRFRPWFGVGFVPKGYWECGESILVARTHMHWDFKDLGNQW